VDIFASRAIRVQQGRHNRPAGKESNVGQAASKDSSATNFTLAVAKHLRLFHVRFTLATFTSLLFDQEENANTSRWFPMCQQSI